MTFGDLDRPVADRDALDGFDVEAGMGLLDMVVLLVTRWRTLVVAALIGGIVAFGIANLLAPIFTARTTFLPPLQQQSGAAAALSSLGALASLAGAGGSKSSTDQYVSLMQSETITDRIMNKFGLFAQYNMRFRADARKELARRVQIAIGKKDGLISVEVDDEDPKKAAAIANQYVEELRVLTSSLSITEAQQRRAFFQHQLEETKERLTAAQVALQASGFSPGAIRAEPRAAAEEYSRLKAQATAAEVKLQSMRGFLSENAQEFRQVQDTLHALQVQLAAMEKTQGADSSTPDYIGKYRQFKYEETLFELYAKQFELARVDEARDGALIQVIDPATPPERKTKPSRLLIALFGVLATGLLIAIWLVMREAWRRSKEDAGQAGMLARLRSAFAAPQANVSA